MKEFYGKIYELIESGKNEEALTMVEEIVRNNTWVFDYASQEELMAYEIIGTLKDEDFNQLLHNIIEERKEDLTEQEKDDTLLLSREVLKITMIEKWFKRADEKQGGKNNE